MKKAKESLPRGSNAQPAALTRDAPYSKVLLLP